ncbi:hypothetical protein EVAR_67352_1 [Eumeta japonica]|uniref:Uncharacterized protein n=1 Tax=Eumeta variegata TaxID=151549 RepID=A0A4C2AAV2_EUMVA|nr:hypothetical protein EVAR_67352_1 [Eumeta japonica]
MKYAVESLTRQLRSHPRPIHIKSHSTSRSRVRDVRVDGLVVKRIACETMSPGSNTDRGQFTKRVFNLEEKHAKPSFPHVVTALTVVVASNLQLALCEHEKLRAPQLEL